MVEQALTMRLRPARVGLFAVLLVATAPVQAGPAVGESGSRNSDLKAVSGYRLNDKSLAQYTAVIRNLVALQKEHPEIVEQLNKDNESENADSIADVVDVINRYPQLSGAITSAGMSVTDYVTCSYALIQTAIYALVAANGDWSKVPAGIPTDNVRYYLANKAKFAQLNDLVNQLNSGGSGGE